MMRYILEVKKVDESKYEIEVSQEEATNLRLGQLYKLKGFSSLSVAKATLWKEFDSIEEAASDNDQCYYSIGNNDGNRTLRSCSASQSGSLWR